ncbi:MAG TPA: cbb3-type cytochrome c oxidase subunit I [bacterium]|nr:cbb3-type cytochrome c oxidase subunit I [bacterium]
MNPTENPTSIGGTNANDASCRVPLLALFGGAALWLVAGLALGIVAVMTFHKPDMFADCAFLTYGRAQAAANDLLLYGFVIPAALGVMLWIFSRLSQAPLALPFAAVAAAHLWHLGVLVGTISILLGDSTGHPWLEYPRAAAVLLFAGFMLIAVTAAATFGFRSQRELLPAHWFLFAALLVFPWIYSTANLFLVSNHMPRGVVQAIIGWWFANNLLFVWLSLVGVGIAFYFIPKLAGKPLAQTGYALFAFLTLIFFGTWSGIPTNAPVPAWLPVLSSVASALVLVPIVAILIVTLKTLCGANIVCQNDISCFIKFGMASFVASGLLYVSQFCPQYSRVLDFTWFGVAESQFQLLGFVSMILFGAIYYILPRLMGTALPFPKFATLHFWFAMAGVLLFVVPLFIGGMKQGHLLANGAPFAESSAVALKFLRISTTGQLIMLLGALLLTLNILVMTLKWKLGLAKALFAAVTAPLETLEVKS